MAQSTLHFSAGMLAGTICIIRRLLENLRTRKPLSGIIGKWIILSYTLGIYAAFPAILRRLGLPQSLTDGWWSNIFIFYHLIEKLHLPSIALGELLSASIFAAQYAVILFAIYQLERNRQK